MLLAILLLALLPPFGDSGQTLTDGSVTLPETGWVFSDADAWNALHPEEEPITVNLDFTDEVRRAMEERAS